MMVLRCSDLSVKYASSQWFVFENLSFGLDFGQTLIVTGKNGSGKTTLVNAVLGLLDESCIVSGSINVCGIDITQDSRKQMIKLRREIVSCMPQDTVGSFDPMQSIGKQIKSILKGNEKDIYAMFQKLGFTDVHKVLKSYPHNLSVGMLSRCMLVMSIITNPKLLILDEPTASLNKELKLEILKAVAEYQRESNCAIMMITHEDEFTEGIFMDSRFLHMGEKDD